MNELLKKDIIIKIFSVLFAVLLWLYVLDNANPIKLKVLNVPLTVLNENTLMEKGIELKNKNYPKTISVTVKGRDEELKKVEADDFEAVLDFTRVKAAADKELAVVGPRYSGKSDITIGLVKPSVISLEMEKIQKNQFHVDIVTSGDLKQGYKIVKITTVPENISLQATDSLIKSVAAIKVVVDVGNLGRDLAVKKDCKVYNKKGAEIPVLSKNLSADIKIEVAKEVPVVVVVKGKPAKNFTDAARKVKPSTVLITGTPDVLAKISELKTEPIDIENSSGTVDTTRLIKLPEGVKIYGTAQEVAVSVVIEQLS